MEHLPLDDLLASFADNDSPAIRLYLYRILHLLSNRGSAALHGPPITYQGARQLAFRLGLDNPDSLVKLFQDLGLGTLKLEIGPDYINAALNGRSPDRSLMPERGCELERGLLDGALQLITGLPVATFESECRGRGSKTCVFEARREDFGQAPGFVAPAGLSGHSQGFPGGGAGGSGAGGDFGSAGGGFGATAGGGFTNGSSAGFFGAGGGGFAGAYGFPGSGPRFMGEIANGVGFGGGPGSKRLSVPGLKPFFMDLAARELARTKRHGRQLSVVYIDLDDLGRINTAHGRPAGDQVLSAVTAALSKSCRTEDLLWHNGEDEFAIVLCETDQERADLVTRRLLTEILSAAEYLDVPATVSASIGFSTYPAHAESLGELFKGARSAVYLAKSRGKGRAQMAGRRQAGGAEVDGEREAGVGLDRDRQSANPAESSPAATPRSYRSTDVPDDQADMDDGSGAAPSDSAAGSSEETSGQPIRLVIALSSPLMMAGMREVLSADESITIVQEITNPARVAAVVADERPDIVFLDQHIVQSEDYKTLKLINEENLPCKCAVFVNEIDQDVIRLAADFKVDGIVQQDSSAQETIDALHTIYKGRTVMPPEVQSAMGELESNRRLLGELSERELEVLRLVAEGKSNAQISEDLFITVNTVRFHLANIYQKLSVSNRTEAANYFLRQDLATPDGQTKLL